MILADELGLSERARSAVFHAVNDVLHASASEGRLGPRATALAALAARELGVDPPPRSVDVAAALPDPAHARALADVLVIAACIEGRVTPEGEAAVVRIARALNVRSPWVDLLPALRKRRVLVVKQALARRSPDGKRVITRTLREGGMGGLGGVLEIGTFLLGLHRDAPLAARYRALQGSGPDTLGRRFYDHLVSRGLNFPGEKGGIPERMIHHDLMHVVNGYDTDPAGECELAGFYAGYCARFGIDDWFTFFMVALATFQLDLPVSPAVVSPSSGAFDPERVLRAFRRGRRMQVDVMGAWDHWSMMPEPIEEVRRALGIDGA